MSKEKFSARIWRREEDFLEGPSYCLEIFCYFGEGISVCFHDELIADIYSDTSAIYWHTDAIYRLGVLYYDFVKVMRKLNIDVECLDARFVSQYEEVEDND